MPVEVVAICFLAFLWFPVLYVLATRYPYKGDVWIGGYNLAFQDLKQVVKREKLSLKRRDLENHLNQLKKEQHFLQNMVKNGLEPWKSGANKELVRVRNQIGEVENTLKWL